MLSKALWYKNYKQSKFVCWAFLIVSLIVPFNVYSQENNLKYLAENFPPLPEGIYISFFQPTLIFQLFVLVILAALLTGVERNNYHFEFGLSLPVTRQSLFLSKWAMGVFVILSGVTLSVLLSLWQFSIAKYLPEYIVPSIFLQYWLAASLLLISVYTFALMLGYMTGNSVAQVGLSFITLLLPYGLYHLVQQFFVYHQIYIQNSLWWWLRDFSEQATLPFVLIEYGQFRVEKGFVQPDWFSSKPLTSLDNILVVSIAYIIIAFLVTLWLSKYSRVEHHGKILLFKPLEHVLKIGVFFCFFLLGGLIIGDSMRHTDGPALLSYYLGGLVFAFIAFFILTKLLNLKLAFRKS